MVRTGDEIASVPAYILEGYEQLGVSDKDILTVIAFLSVRQTGRSLWERVAVIRGYGEVRYLQAAMKKLAEGGLVRVDGWDLDFAPLFNKCRSGVSTISEPVSLLSGVVVEKPKESNKRYLQFCEVFKHRIPGQNVNAWAQAIKPLVDELDATPREIDQFLAYQEKVINKRRNGKGLTEPVAIYHLKYFAAWREAGCPSKPQTKSKDLGVLDDLV